VTSFTPHTDDEVGEMLATIGAGTVDELFETIPADLRLSKLRFEAQPVEAG